MVLPPLPPSLSFLSPLLELWASKDPKRYLLIAIPTLASAALLGFFSLKKNKRELAAPIAQQSTPQRKKANTMTQEQLSHFLSSDLVPHEILAHILQLLPGEDLARMGQVSRRFSLLVNDGDLWLPLLHLSWPDEDYSRYPSNYLQSLYSKKAKKEKSRLGFKAGRFLLSVMEQCANYADEETNEADTKGERKAEGWWKNRFVIEMNAAMESSGVVFVNEAGVEGISAVAIEVNKKKVGWIKFLDIRDAHKKFLTAKHLPDKFESPYTGGVVGYINFDFDSTENRDIFEEFLQSVLYETRGAICRTDTGYFRRSVQLKNVPLSELFAENGMDDGDSFLDSDPNSSYMQTIMRSARTRLAAEPSLATVVVKYVNVSKNPLRCSDPFAAKLADLDLPVWLFDVDILHDKNLLN